MKKFFVIFLITVLLMGLFIGCNNEETNSLLGDELKEDVKLNVYVDYKIELLSVVQYLADFKYKDYMITNKESDYKEDIDKFFSGHKNHPVISLYEKLSNRGFTYHVPTNLMLCISDDIEVVDEKLKVNQDVILRSGGNKKVDEFIEQLRDFKEVTNFDAFYNEHKGYYDKLVTDISKKLESTDCLNVLREYYGSEQHSYNIVITPLNAGGYGIRMPRENSKLDIYCVIPPVQDKKGLTSFVWHEFSHSYVNPLTEENSSEVFKYMNLYDPIRDVMKKQAYGRWDACVNEHIVRAITSRLSSKEFGEDASINELKYHRKRSFFYIDALYEKLDEYENNRSKYKTFKDFYPCLIDVFKEFSEKELGEDFYKLEDEGQ
ncbi:DUF4932 domain-containing protein [Abyssisolibacter fermentans]|uniref:DUF4932 domain-containing protein n=1 Tax=Abyssisolibacter fermentans TaxID=1766203 RepID=UPI000835F294|nr:DUF4932 domain-containing protein [Abyssisolibacter fermentans]